MIRSLEQSANLWRYKPAILIGLILMVLVQSALADRAWTRRYYVNTNGDLVLVGNLLQSCNSATTTPDCAGARAGTVSTSNYYFTASPMVDADADGSTTSSSSADLNMPAGSTVVWAGLYWGAKYPSGGGVPAAAKTIRLKTPLVGYQTINASVIDNNDPGGVNGATYQAFADVTALVAAGGNGTYWAANISSVTTIRNGLAGWALFVIYSNDTLPFRNFAVYDGFGFVDSTTISLTSSDFLTPLSGPVVSRLGVLLWDGDIDASGAGEGLSLNTVFLNNALNPANNQWNGSITDLAVRVTSKYPDYVNQLGMDLDRYNVPSGILPNGSTSATIGISSPGNTEVFWAGAASFMTDIYVPIIVPNVVKTAVDVNGGNLVAGDVLRWNVVMSNTGLDSGVNVIATDNIPAYLTYKPGSLVITAGANAGAKTDGTGDDQADYFSSGPARVVFRLGTGANASNGGVLPYGANTTFTFETTVDTGVPAGTLLTNAVQIQYSGQTIGDTFAASSAAATATIFGPPAISKLFVPDVIDTGDASRLNIVVSNPTGNPQVLNDVIFSDTYPSGLVNAGTPNPQITCTPGSTAGTITGGSAGGNTIGMNPGATLAVNGSCTIKVSVTSATINNYVNTTGTVSSSNGGAGATATATLSVGKPRITKAFGSSSILSGGSIPLTINIANLAATGLTNVAFTDTLTNLTVASTPSATNTCGGSFQGRTGAGAWGAPAAGNNQLRLTGGVLAATANCTLSVNITSTTMGLQTNTASGVSSTESGTAGNPSNTASLLVIAPPVLTKSFFPPSVRTAVPSTMTLTLSNPNPTATITGATFTDGVSPVYPTGLLNSTPSSVAQTCTPGSSATLSGGAAGGGNVGLSSAMLLPGGSCTVTLNVQSSTTGNKANTTSTITTTNAGTGTAASATLNVTTLTAPTVTKAFAASPITTSGNTTMTITLSNSNASAVTGVQFTDVFPSGLKVYTTPGMTNSCSGTVEGRTGLGSWGSVAAGNTSLRLTGGTINASSSCAVAVAVSSAISSSYINSTGTVITANAGTFGPATAPLQVLAPPQVTKSFSPDTIARDTTGTGGVGLYSTLTITLTNPTTATTSLTGVSVEDWFAPAIPIVAHNTPTETLSAGCTGPGAPATAPSFLQGWDGTAWVDTVAGGHTRIRLNNLTMAPNTTCTASIRVRSGTSGIFTNTTKAVTTTNGGTGGTASAILSVGQVDITKSFCTNPIASGATCAMTIAIANTTGLALTGAAFTDTYPANMTNTGTPNATISGAGCLGTLTAAANGSSLALASGNIPTTGCTITVNVQASQTVTNTIAAGALTANTVTPVVAVSNGAATSAVLNIYALPVVEKSFATSSILVGGSTSMTIRITNLNSVNATFPASPAVAFTDTFPGELAGSGPFTLSSATVTNTCGGTVQGRTGTGGAWGTPAVGNTALRLTNGGSINAGSYCTITASVTSNAGNSYTNYSGAVTTTNIGVGTQDSANLVVMGPPSVSKSFTPSTVEINEASLMTIVLTNPNPTAAITGAAFTDTYPAGLVNYSTPAASTSCSGGSVSATAGGNTLSLSGATIAANSSCTVTVQVKSASVGTYPNSLAIGAVTTTNSGSNTAAASASLVVSRPMPNLQVVKLGYVVSDPVNGGTFPKSIPGALVSYQIRVTNTGPGTIDNNTVIISDPIPVATDMYVGNLGGAGLGPVMFTDGTPPSGLSWSFITLGNGSDSVDFSTNGTVWTYTPVPDANGFDANVRYIRLKPTGIMDAAGGGNPYFEVAFRVRVQ